MSTLKASSKEIAESRKKALDKIKSYLDSADIEGQFLNKPLLVTWLGNYKGVVTECKIESCDAIYLAGTMFCCIHTRTPLDSSKKEVRGFYSFERALISKGLILCDHAEKRRFFNAYLVPFQKRSKGFFYIEKTITGVCSVKA